MDDPLSRISRNTERVPPVPRQPLQVEIRRPTSGAPPALGPRPQLYRLPLIETLSPYESSHLTVEQACAALNVPQEAADFITRGLFRSDVPLHRHQFEAWERSRAGRPVIVTSGTGSGKTEAYLLPIFFLSSRECLRGWGVPQPVTSQRFWWRARRQDRISQRSHESAERRPAVRALLLFPLNALIEDQLSRIRKACDGAAARAWFTGARTGQRFWFGRYNSVAPVSGPQDNRNKRRELKRRLNLMDVEWTRAQAAAHARNDRRVLDYFQNPMVLRCGLDGTCRRRRRTYSSPTTAC